jgi:hypothetical protein
MTYDQRLHFTPDNEPLERAPGELEQTGTRGAYPVRVDETSQFTRAELQKTLMLELPADLRSRLMETPAPERPAAPVFDEAAAYRGHTLRLDRRDIDRALEQTTQSPVVAPARDGSGGLDPMATVYDGGALREHALKLSEALDGAAARDAAQGPNERDAPSDTAAPHEPKHRLGLHAVAGAWRKASLARRAIAVLFPLAALATLWPDEAAEARPTAPVARAPVVKPQPAPVAKPQPAPADHAAPPPVATAARLPTETAPAEATPTQRFIEAQALKAAFSGDTAAAAKQYERLARELGDPRFELALRLVRADAMRRP